MKTLKSTLRSGLFSCYFLCFCLFLLTSCGGSKKVSSSARTPSRQAAKGDSSREERKKESSKQDLVVATARGYMGTPYKWGGTTKSGMDCSGLLVCSFRAAKIELPRTSAEQSSYGKKVSMYELQPGDLVFFAANKGRGKITHVGMVTEVRGREEVIFIHASSSLGVVENNLYSDYYRKIFIKAQRPF